jgi:hypothetical protein
MSEAERKRRLDYKQKRSKWILIQAIAIALVAVIAIGSFLIYNHMNRTYYINYKEAGSVDYKVHYRENNFFEEEWIGPDQAYVVSLIDNILADFKYDIAIDADKVNFNYSYSLNARIYIMDKVSGDPLFSPEFELVPEKTASVNGNSLRIREQLEINYVEYNRLTKSFIDTYGIAEPKCHLAVTLNVSVLSKCEEFKDNSDNSYFISLNIPLNLDTIDMNVSSSVTEDESKVLACSGAVNQNIFLVSGIIAAVLDVILGAILLAFAYLTRNEDINYTIRVKKLVSAYRSFIQQISGEFDTDGYQIIYIKSFIELLGIRDTIQSPVLMSENTDQTCTSFLIPTNTKLLYIFEVKVDNYDEIYGTAIAEEPEPEIKEEPEQSDAIVAEAVILDTGADLVAVAEAIAAPDVVLDDIDFVPDDDDQFAVAEDEAGVEVVGVVWPERPHRNKVYRYDPNGEKLNEGDVVLVPTRDVEKDREVIRKAAVAHENHRVAEEHIKHPLKKIIGVVKRKVENALVADSSKENKN